MSADRMSGKHPAQPGAALKRLRTGRGLTLAEMSERTGFPISSLSKMENDKTALTLEKLLTLSDALEVDIGEMFNVSSTQAASDGAMRRSITRAGDGESIETPRGNYLYLAAELLHKKVIPIFGEVFANDISTYGEFSQHEGEEFIYVLEGTLELHTEMYTPVILEVGDSVYFDSAMRHAYIAAGNKSCRILSICATADPYFTRHEADAARPETGTMPSKDTTQKIPRKTRSRNKT
jgi:transcriptional regulator with XRE-family HTH domain